MTKFLLIFIWMQSLLVSAVYDCFTFCNEFELLELRFEELNECVDYFVIVEGTMTFEGNPKPLHFLNNKDRFKKYEEKIIHIILNDFPKPKGNDLNDHWAREIYSRNEILQALSHCKPDDIIFISDLDEIPRRAAVYQIIEYIQNLTKLSEHTNVDEDLFVCELSMRFFMFYLNCENTQMLWVGGSKAIPYWFLEKHSPWEIKIYHHTHFGTYKLPNAGWHFHAMGGVERATWKWLNTPPKKEAKPVLKKLKRDKNYMKKYIQSECVKKTKIVPIDDSFPEYVRQHEADFQAMGWIKNS